jgi:molybdate transport repressor ModE-like protein
MGVDLESLRLLLALDASGSIGAAARDLGITQPAASARLRAMEARHGLNLVARSARGSVLTEDGRAVAGWARTVLREVEMLETGLDALTEQRRGSVSIAASLTIAEYLVPGWIASLRTRFPDVVAGLVVVNSDEVVAMVCDGRVRIGFVEGPVEPAGLVMKTVGHDELIVAAAPEHVWARTRRPVSRDELLAMPLVLREPGSGTRTTFEQVVGAEPRVALQASSTHAVLGAAISNVGPAVISEIAARQDIEAGRLVAVPTELNLRRSLRATWRANARLRSPLTDLIDIAADGA